MSGLLLEPVYPTGSYIAHSRWLHSVDLVSVQERRCGVCWLSGATPWSTTCAHDVLVGSLGVVYARQAHGERRRVLLAADPTVAGLVADMVAGVTVTSVAGPAVTDQWSLLVREGGGA